MTIKTPDARALAVGAAAAAALAAAWPAPAIAQYKVVAPDGSVTYTDRPPADAGVRVTPIGRSGAAATPEQTGLPAELRLPAQRFPVVLYAAAECPPCDSGRRLLQQRGIPYTERHVVTDDDAQALERLSGGRTLPALTIGTQPLRGYSEADWTAYLDVAGYPRQSRLPANWPTPVARPMTERASPPAAAAAPAAEPRLPAETAPAAGGLRF